MVSRVVVVVEDDPGMREALEKVLRAAGVRALLFGSGEELIEAGEAERASCLVLDIRLPGMTGFELCRWLASRGQTAPVIFITAYDDAATRAEAERLGAVGYLLKPFGGKELVLSINRAIAASLAS